MKHCKICFKEIGITDFCRFFDGDIVICANCQKALEPKFIRFKADDYDALAFYDYSEFIKKQIFLYKGCFDYEMKDIFLNLFIKEIKLRYRDYKIIPIPSYVEDDKTRGFNHVIEICKMLGLSLCQVLEKTSHFKQAEKGAKQRQEIKKHLAINNSVDLTNEKVLIVDDIYTTGSTMSAAIKLIETLHPKKIKVLVLAKTKPKEI